MGDAEGFWEECEVVVGGFVGSELGGGGQKCCLRSQSDFSLIVIKGGWLSVCIWYIMGFGGII